MMDRDVRPQQELVPHHTTPHHNIPYHTTPHLSHHTRTAIICRSPQTKFPELSWGADSGKPRFPSEYHTTQNHTKPHHSTPYQTIPSHTIPYHTISYHSIPHHTIPYGMIGDLKTFIWTSKSKLFEIISKTWRPRSRIWVQIQDLEVQIQAF